MKIKYLILIIGLFFCNNIYAQDIVSQLKQFHENADMDCYIDKIEKNVNEYFVVHNKLWGRDEFNISPKKVELHKEEIVPMLTIQFVGTDTFKYSDNIYNYITLDSMVVYTLARVDEKMNVTAFAHFFGGVHGYQDIEKKFSTYSWIERRKLKKIIKNIKKQEPELILYSHAIRGFHDDNGFMYIKNGKIFVYRVFEKDIYELNDYIQKFYSLESIRDLNTRYIPLIYGDLGATRKTGHTPEDQKLICH